MEQAPQMSREQFVAAMRHNFETMLGKVADAINEAPAGRVIAGSEEQVRDLFADLREQAYQLGLQMRMDAAQAAFPPSSGPDDPQEKTP